ncbi:putative O-methyltransferase COMT-type [Helianthus anomalus]
MLLMTLTTGRERSEQDWAKLFIDAGFIDYKMTPILGCGMGLYHVTSDPR